METRQLLDQAVRDAADRPGGPPCAAPWGRCSPTRWCAGCVACRCPCTAWASHRPSTGSWPRPLTATSPPCYRHAWSYLACDFDLEDNYFAWQAFGRGYDREHRRALRRRAQRRTHRPRPLLHLRRLPPLLPSGVSAMDAARQMDRMYRYQRHIYDLTRKYYLLGRDRLIATLDAGPGETFCEVGCGTGRNLVKAARRYPASHWYGVDPSAAMLRSAETNLRRARLHQRATLAPAEAATLDPAEAATLDPEAHLGLADPLDGVWFSYALSMIPDWRPAVDQALAITHPSGRIHAVDFGDLDGLPPWFRRLLTAWLARFGVHRKPAIAAYFRELAGRGYGQVEIQPLYRGYAELIHFEKI